MNLLEAFQNFVEDAGEVVTNTVTTIANWVTNAVEDATESVTNIGSAVVDFVASGIAAINDFFGGDDDDDDHEPSHGSSGNKQDEEREQQQAFDFDIAQVEGKFGSADSDLAQPFELGNDFPTYSEMPKYETSIWDELEIVSLALSNPLVRTIKLMSTTTEADLLDSVLKTAPSAEAALNLMFAQAGYDEEMDQEAVQVLEQYMKRRSLAQPDTFPSLLQDDQDLPPEVDEYLSICLEEDCAARLEEYGVTVLRGQEGTEEVQSARELGINAVANEITPLEYAILLASVDQVSESLLPHVRGALGDDTITKEEAFARVFGNIRIATHDNMGKPETVSVGTPTDLTNPIYIKLDDSDFTDLNRSPLVYHPTFIVIHELGHALYNRHEGRDAAIANENFLAATESTFEDGVYIPGGYEGFEGKISTFFSNERVDEAYRTGTDPDEGFSDTFSIYLLFPDRFGADNLRRQYFASGLPQWVNEIVNR